MSARLHSFLSLMRLGFRAANPKAVPPLKVYPVTLLRETEREELGRTGKTEGALKAGTAGTGGTIIYDNIRDRLITVLSSPKQCNHISCLNKIGICGM